MQQLNHHDMRWILRRCPQQVLHLIKSHPNTLFAAGGFIRSVITGEDISDIDLFAPSKDLAKSFAEQLSSGGRIHETDNAYTVKHPKLPYPVQFIHRWTFSNPGDMIKSFDFTIAAAGFWNDGRDGWLSACHDDYYQDLAARRLIYTSPVRDEEVGGSLLRVLKFYQRGYRIPLDSLGAVIARLMRAVRMEDIGSYENPEAQLAKVVTGLLREVDPNVGEDHIAYLRPDDGDE